MVAKEKPVKGKKKARKNIPEWSKVQTVEGWKRTQKKVEKKKKSK